MAEPPDVGGDVVAGGAALAGFILVYLGAVGSTFASYGVAQQAAVVSSFQRRAWFAVTGIMLALTSVALGLLGKWLAITRSVDCSVIVFLITLAWSAWTAVVSALDIRHEP